MSKTMNFGKMLNQMLQLRELAKNQGMSDDEIANIEFVKQDQLGDILIVKELTYTIVESGKKKYIVQEPVIKKI